ncbi:MAG: T9SS type A sorting domain-containing protein [Bacteroidales bacterium]|nr:T9SS type A sorting domain-containing protein [Bacteroidales bacterium]
MKKASFPSRMLLICLVVFLINTFDLYANEDFKGWEFKTGHTGMACGNLTFTDHSLTIEFWINMNQLAATTESTNVIETFGDPYGFIINIRKNSVNNNALELRLFAKDRQATPGTVYFFIPADKYTDRWAHIAFVISEADQKAYAYVNGVLYGTTNAVGGYYGNYKSDGTTTRALNVGGAFWSSPKFIGKLADLRIWSVARSAQQIKDNYNKHIEGSVTGLFINYKFLTYERGIINDANPLVTTNKGWCNPSTNWSTYYATESLSVYARNLSLSNGLLQWNTSAGAWEVAVFKVDDNTNVFTDTIATNSISLRDIAELGVGLSYYTKVRTQNNGFYSNWVTTENFSIDRYYRFSGNGAWNDPSNWEKSYDNVNWIGADVVPSSASATAITIQNGQSVVVNNDMTANSVTVKAGGNLTLNEAANVNISSLTLESNSGATATLLDNYSTPTIRATVQQYVDAGRNWYVSSPVSVASYTVLDKGTSVVEFNEVTKNWDPVASGNLTPGKGYIQVASASQPGSSGTIVFADKLTNSGDITVQLTRTESGSSRGFNLVGNPYPSYLDWSKVAAANPNVLPTAWFRTKKTVEAGGGYTFATVNVKNETPIIVNGDANTAITNYIPPMQAYWVRLVENPVSNNFTVTNAMRDYPDNTENKLKSPRQNNIKMIRLQVSNGNSTDETVLYSTSAASDSYDRYDSPKMSNTSPSVPEIFTQIGSEKLVINGMNEIKYDTEIPLGFSTLQADDFSIRAFELNNFDSNTIIVLKDNDLKTEQDLTNGTTYNFKSGITNTAYRFSLIFRVKGTTTEVTNSPDKIDARVFVNTQNQITIVGPEKCIYRVYNTLGQKQLDGILKSTNQCIDKLNVSGVYFVELSTNGHRKTIKVVIH